MIYNAYDALLIDDVDKLTGKEAAQTALFRMIDFKFIAEKPLVFTVLIDTPSFCPRLQMRINVAHKYELPLVTVDGLRKMASAIALRVGTITRYSAVLKPNNIK